MLGSTACVAVPSLCGAGDQTYEFLSTRQILYQLSHIPSSRTWVMLVFVCLTVTPFVEMCLDFRS